MNVNAGGQLTVNNFTNNGRGRGRERYSPYEKPETSTHEQSSLVAGKIIEKFDYLHLNHANLRGNVS